MSVRHWNRWVLPHVLRFVLAGALVAGCRDDSPGNDGTRYGNDAEMTAPADGEAAALRGQDRLKKRNTREWVGAAHNRMLDDFRTEMRKPGMLTRNICEYVMSFSMSDDRLPAGRKHLDNRNWVGVRAAGDSSTLCSVGSRGPRASNISMRWFTPTAPVTAPQSAESLALQAEIEKALSTASDARDLAMRLSAIYERSLTLPEAEQAAVASTISVAQNSFEYWTQQYGLFEQEVIAEYAPCIEEQLAMGATDRVIESCLTGKNAGGAVAGRSLGTPKQQLVRIKPLAQCGYSIREGFRRIGLADAKGAATGFFSTLLSTGSIEAAGLAAIASAGASSIWAAVENAVVALKCMYGMT